MVLAQAGTQSQQSPLILAGLLLIASCGLFYGYLIHPLREELDETQNSISSLRSVLAKREMEEIRLANSSALAVKQRKHLNTLLFPLQKQPISVLQALQDLASANQIGISWHAPRSKRTPLNKNEGEHVSYQFVTVELAGKYHNLRDYFEGVCQLDRILGIEGYEIGATKEDTRDSTTLQAKLILLVPSPESRHDENITNP